MKGLSLQVRLSDFIMCCNCSNMKDLISMHCEILGGDFTVDTESVVLHIIFHLSMFMSSFIKFSRHLNIITYLC